MCSLWISLLAIVATALAVPNRRPFGLIRESSSPLTKQQYGTVGAKLTYIQKYPFTVSITFDKDQSLIGGGAILDKNWIVTSAYPLANFLSDARNISIRAGSIRADSGGQQLKVSRIIIHEKFNSYYWYNIALIKTTTDINFCKKAKPITLASSSPQPGVRAEIVGFGNKVENMNCPGLTRQPVVGFDSISLILTPTKSKADGHLQVASVRMRSYDTCNSVYGYIGPTGQCADAKGVGPCYGDFGNPLVYKKQLIGFYLGGDICNFYDLMEIYSNIPTLKSWIEDHIKSNSTLYRYEENNNEQFYRTDDEDGDEDESERDDE